ncbi:MAG TPA: hypothetical protein VL443_22985 [Cyclobacteriaceae bacterium]|nr:hypothetical protein [Cyclobacteriaceae bacterium]
MLLINRFTHWNEKRGILLITIGFIISRILFYIAGISFYGNFLKRLWQSIDFELLKTDLFQSLYYSHAQPPLFNFLTGVVVKVFPEHYGFVFHVLFVGITWLTTLILYVTLRKLDLPSWLCLLVSFYYCICPSVVLYENLPSYTSVVVLIITISVFCFITFLQQGQSIYWLLFWIFMSLLSMTRSSYHLVWLLALLILMIIFLKHKRVLSFKRVVLALFPVFMVLTWYVKNFILFGVFTASSWMGMNMARIMPPETTLGTVGPFKSLKEYPDIKPNQSYAHVTLLHEEVKQKTGYINFYHIDYITVSEQFKKEVLTEIKNKPTLYFKRVMGAFKIYFCPSTHGPFLDKNYRHIKTYASIINADFSGYQKFRKDFFPTRDAIPAVFSYMLLFCFMIYGFKRKLFKENDRVLILFLVFIVVSSMMISNILEYGENNRFRFEMITVILILLAKLSWVIVNDFRSRYYRSTTNL